MKHIHIQENKYLFYTKYTIFFDKHKKCYFLYDILLTLSWAVNFNVTSLEVSSYDDLYQYYFGREASLIYLFGWEYM